MSSQIHVDRATLDDLSVVTPLFDAYRQFYGQPSDLVGAGEFLSQRLTNDESVVLLATTEGRAVGFTQLYPAFSSVAMKPIWILNDLFVASNARRGGVARVLLDAASDIARQAGAVRLVLATAHDNAPARSLYEATGWSRDNTFVHYNYPLT